MNFVRPGQEGLRPLSEVGEECGAFALEADFFCSTVGGALFGYCAELLNEFDVLDTGHHIGDTVSRCIDICGGHIGGKVGANIGALSHCSPCALDLIAEAVTTLIMWDIVSFSVFASEGEPGPLFHMLSVVLVLADKIGVEVEVSHSMYSFPLLYHNYTT